MAKTKRLQPERELRLNTILSLQRQNDIISMMLNGKEPSEIRHYLCTKYKHTPNTANFYMKEARAVIKDRKNLEVNDLISLHISRYEKIYEKLYELNASSMAMRALKAKEKLMGFHKEGFHMRVNKGELTTISLQTVDSEYDVLKLPEEKRLRLDQLLKHAKRFNSKNVKQVG